jgi:uncharacterized integral membrane protein
MPEETSSRSKRSINGKLIAIGLLVLLLVIFTALNTHDVSVDYIFGTFDTSMIVVIVLSAAFGFALGALLMHRRDNKNSN